MEDDLKQSEFNIGDIVVFKAEVQENGSKCHWPSARKQKWAKSGVAFIVTRDVAYLKRQKGFPEDIKADHIGIYPVKDIMQGAVKVAGGMGNDNFRRLRDSGGKLPRGMRGISANYFPASELTRTLTVNNLKDKKIIPDPPLDEETKQKMMRKDGKPSLKATCVRHDKFNESCLGCLGASGRLISLRGAA